MAQVTVQLLIRPKWWMLPAVSLAVTALRLGLVRDKPSREHWGGIVTAEERVAKWLADFAFRFEVR